MKYARYLLFSFSLALAAICIDACKGEDPQVDQPVTVNPGKEEEKPEEGSPSNPEDQPGVPAYSVGFTSNSAHNISMKKTADATYELTLSGDDPYIFTEKIPSNLDPALCMLEFEYKSGGEVDVFQIFYALKGAPSEASSKKYGSLEATSTFKT